MLYTSKIHNNWLVLLAIAVGTIMVPINASMVNVALPTITEYFSTSLVVSEWIITSYLISQLGLVLFFGRIGDAIGLSKIYMIGLVSFIVSSFFCSISPSIEALIIFRSLQGVAAAMMISVSMGIIKSNFPNQNSGKVLGIYSVAIAAGLAFGPLIGGIILNYFTWQAMFLFNIPLGIISFLFCLKVLKRSPIKSITFDPQGVVLQLMVVFCLVSFFNFIEKPWIDNTTIYLGSVAIIGTLLFIWNERRIKTPLIDLTLFKKPKFVAFTLSLFFNYICMYMNLFIMPFYLQKVLQAKPLMVGLLLAAPPLTMMFWAPLSGKLSDLIGPRPLALIGSLIMALSFFLMRSLTIFSSLVQVLIILSILGMGAGLFQAPNNSAIMSLTKDEDAGITASIIVTTRNLGMIFGVCLASLLLYNTINPSEIQNTLLFNLAAYNFTEGLHLIGTLGMILSVTVACLSIFGINPKRKKEIKRKAIYKIKKNLP